MKIFLCSRQYPEAVYTNFVGDILKLFIQNFVGDILKLFIQNFVAGSLITLYCRIQDLKIESCGGLIFWQVKFVSSASR